MLGHTYRYRVYNGTGGTVTVTLKTRAYKYDSSGALSFNTEQTRISASAISTASYGGSGTVDNSTDKYIGAAVVTLLDVSTTVTGPVVVYLQQSTDGGTTWPSDGQGDPICSYYFNSSSTDVYLNAMI